MVFNSEQRKSIIGKPPEKFKISSELAQKFLKRILIILNYIGELKHDTIISPKETEITLENNSSFTLYKL